MIHKDTNSLNDDYKMTLRLTLIMLLLCSLILNDSQPILHLLCFIPLLLPKLLESRSIWIGVLSTLIINSFQYWDVIDNHAYLVNYWVLTIVLSLLSRNNQKEDILKSNAGSMIGYCMIFAVAWKCLSDDYMNGSFFNFELLFDSRLGSFARFISGMSLEDYEFNKNQLNMLHNGHMINQEYLSLEVINPARVKLTALALSLWGVFLELAIGLAFTFRIEKLFKYGFFIKHLLLLLFLFTTYTIATVVGFGWTLCILGFVDSDQKPLTQKLYLLAFIIIYFYTLPFGKILSL